ncbi:PssE/Cps14G family polysaccharide biosynthesis glycosyltransferase [Enterococcus faecium]
MIFVTLGSQKFQFNRLLQYLDELIEENKIEDRIIAQVGFSDYIPCNFDYKPFFSRDEFLQYMKRADIILTHAGTGSIITALKERKKVIAIPRLKKYKEHVDDHQIEITQIFTMNGYLLSANSKYELLEMLDCLNNRSLKKFDSNNSFFCEKIKNYVRMN